MKANKLKATVSIFSMLLCFTVFAQRSGAQGGKGGRQGPQGGGKPNAVDILAKLDINKDDKIDKDEAAKDRRGKISQDFNRIDTNNDAFIDLEELKTSLGGRVRKRISPERILKETDDNGDGKLNRLEIAAKEKLSLTNNFEKIDTNKDSEIDLEELKVFFSKHIEKNPKRKEKPRKRRN